MGFKFGNTDLNFSGGTDTLGCMRAMLTNVNVDGSVWEPSEVSNEVLVVVLWFTFDTTATV